MSAHPPDEVDRIAHFLGQQQFNRLRASVAETRERRRFRYWQEDLLQKISENLGIEIKSVDEFVALLADAPAVTAQLTREEFLAKPYDYFDDEHVEFDESWIADAWNDDKFRESVSYELARSISKTGSFALVSKTVERISPYLDVQQMSGTLRVHP